MTSLPTTTARQLQNMNGKQNKIPAPHLGQLRHDYPVFGAVGTRLIDSLPHIWGSQAVLGVFVAPYLGCFIYMPSGRVLVAGILASYSIVSGQFWSFASPVKMGILSVFI